MGVVLHRLAVPQNDIQMDVEMAPVVDNSTVAFATPDDFVHLGANGLTIAVHLNGSRLTSPGDFSVSESGGVGAGFDTVTLTCAPKTGHILRADYVKA